MLFRSRGLDLWLRYVQVYRSRIELDRGRWVEAAAAIPASVQDPGTPLPRIVALVVLGLLRARRGDPGQWSALDEAAELASACGELQWAAPVAAAVAPCTNALSSALSRLRLNQGAGMMVKR